MVQWSVNQTGADKRVAPGNVVFRTGRPVYLPGGTAPDGRWETCSGAKELP